MKKIILLISFLAGSACNTLLAQQPWRFHIAFEDGTGACDTLWMIFDNSATVEGVDYQLGEGTPKYDPGKFNVFMYNRNVDSTKVKAYPYSIYPNMSTDEVFAINYTYPVIIRWDPDLFHAPYLPITPPLNIAVVAGDYFWNEIGADCLHCVNMYNRDSLFCESESPAPLFSSNTSFVLAYDPYLSVKTFEKTFDAYPNPVKNILYLKGNEYIKSYSIFNMEGIRIAEKHFEPEMQLSSYPIYVTTFPPGIFIIQLFNHLNQMSYEKFVVKH